jgi:hypothetical protein
MIDFNLNILLILIFKKLIKSKMFIEQFLQILTFFLQRGICLVIPNCQDNESNLQSKK